ncbi:MAG TPA: hypothetical protein VGT78_00130 [Rhizomicrobium sp.]|nr:hypothetical protein [Rhizomicrobium sp.]
MTPKPVPRLGPHGPDGGVNLAYVARQLGHKDTSMPAQALREVD